MHKPWQNAEGYTDNTAYQGTKDIIRAESAAERKNRLIIQIFRLVCVNWQGLKSWAVSP